MPDTVADLVQRGRALPPAERQKRVEQLPGGYPYLSRVNQIKRYEAGAA